jgi:peptide/nickel transport system permease protein
MSVSVDLWDTSLESADAPVGSTGGPTAGDAMRQALRSWPVRIAGSALLLTVVVALLAPLISPTELGVRVGHGFEAPSWHHPLGLDDGGQDVLTQLVWGARTSLIVGFAAAVLAALVGTTIGIVAGFAGGLIENVLMRVTDYALAVPDVPLMIVVAALFGASLSNIILVIALLSWAGSARLIRAETKSIAARSYVLRARSLGASRRQTILWHILPHLTPLIAAVTVLTIAVGIFAETALAFLGLGDPNRPSWGTMIENAFTGTATSAGAWWAILPPGLAVCVVIISCTVIGRSIERAVNPRMLLSHLGQKRFTYEGPASDAPAKATA